MVGRGILRLQEIDLDCRQKGRRGVLFEIIDAS